MKIRASGAFWNGPSAVWHGYWTCSIRFRTFSGSVITGRYNLLSVLMDACADVLESLADEVCEKGTVSRHIRNRIR